MARLGAGGEQMQVRCPNCDEYTELPCTIDAPLDAPYCEFCECPLHHYSNGYRRCTRCGVRTLDVFPACEACQFPFDTRATSLSAAACRSASVAAPWHVYVPIPGARDINAPYTVIRSIAQLEAALPRIAAAPALAVDTETTGLDPYASRLLLLQIATPRHVFVIDLTGLDRPAAGDVLRPILERPTPIKILHNASFDYKFIRLNLGIRLKGIFDTMLAHYVLSAGTLIQAALQSVSRLYLDVELEKDIRTTFENAPHLTEQHYEYAAKDAAILFPVYDAISRQLEADRLTHIAQIEFDAVEPIAEMELAGLLVNIPDWQQLIDAHKTERDVYESQVLESFATAGEPANGNLFEDLPQAPAIKITSQKDVIEAFRSLGIRIEDTSEETLAVIDHPAAQRLLAFREHDKLVTAFGDAFIQLVSPTTNRIHPDFQQYGAETGRLSCRHPNVQQIPAKFRGCFVAPPGWKVITCDYSQAELRILAQLSKDPGFCEAFKSGGDLHSITASKMFKVKLKDVTKTQRSQAKAINFGLAYGMGAGSLAVRIGVSKEDAQKLIDQYFKAYPNVGDWLARAAESATRCGYSITPLGRKRYYNMPDRSDPEYKAKISSIERQGKNTPIQGANADMTKIALRRIYDSIQPYEARIVNTVHDEIVVEVVEPQANEVGELVAAEMRAAGAVFITEVPVEVGLVVADTWSK